MPDFHGTMHPEDDPLQYRSDETPVDREINRLRIDLSNQIAELTHRLGTLQKTVTMLMTVAWVTLAIVLAAASATGFLVLSR